MDMAGRRDGDEDDEEEEERGYEDNDSGEDEHYLLAYSLWLSTYLIP